MPPDDEPLLPPLEELPELLPDPPPLPPPEDEELPDPPPLPPPDELELPPLPLPDDPPEPLPPDDPLEPPASPTPRGALAPEQASTKPVAIAKKKNPLRMVAGITLPWLGRLRY